MRVSLRSTLVSIGLVAITGLAAPAAHAGNTVAVIVLREHGVGTSATAQPYLDKLIDLAKSQNGWPDAKGKYETARSSAEAWIQAEQPHYGILSIASFLAFKSKFNVEPIGRATVSTGGGQQYFLISKSAGSLAECKGKTLASDHADDARFIEKIVFDGQAKLADFTLDKTTRPVQTINKVVNGDDVCALIDDAQLSQLGQMNASGVKQVWASPKLPPMVVVAFPAAPAPERKAFQASLDKICQGGSQQVCTGANVQSLASGGTQDYDALVKKY